jgi:putative transposase
MPRIDVPGVTYHVILRCNYDEWLLKEDAAKHEVLRRVREASDRHKLTLFAYVIMDNHAHLVLSRGDRCALAEAMRWLMTQSAKDQLRAVACRGHFWRQRYGAIPVEENEYALALLRYLDRNPVGARIATSPVEYPWSSCTAYALGSSLPAITLHPTYLGLGKNRLARQRKYRELIEDHRAGGDDRLPAFSRAPALGNLPFWRRLGLRARWKRTDLAALLAEVRPVCDLKGHPPGKPFPA